MPASLFAQRTGGFGHAGEPQPDADKVVAVIEALVAEREAPGHLRMDNGPKLIA